MVGLRGAQAICEDVTPVQDCSCISVCLWCKAWGFVDLICPTGLKDGLMLESQACKDGPGLLSRECAVFGESPGYWDSLKRLGLLSSILQGHVVNSRESKGSYL